MNSLDHFSKNYKKEGLINNFKDGQLFYLKRMCVPTKLRPKILKEAHEGTLSSHLGYHKMYEILKKRFYWTRMKKDALELPGNA